MQSHELNLDLSDTSVIELLKMRHMNMENPSEKNLFLPTTLEEVIDTIIKRTSYNCYIKPYQY